MGVYGEILYPWSDFNEIGTRVCLKPFNNRGEFVLDREKSKNNIAENSVALGHETHNSCVYFIHLRNKLNTLFYNCNN